MYMFFGDSHSRQFVGVSWGIFAHYVFSGATVKGLANTNSTTGHAAIIKHAVSNTRTKTVFLMFGNVDFDFSLAREAVAYGRINPAEFIKSRLESYTSFITTLLHESPDRHQIQKLCILAPQISPLCGENFFIQTPKHANITQQQLRAASLHNDLSDLTRSLMRIAFTDALATAFAGHPRVELLRIDRHMLDDTGKILDIFVPADPNDHHPVPAITQQLWQPLIAPHITDHEITG